MNKMEIIDMVSKLLKFAKDEAPAANAEGEAKKENKEEVKMSEVKTKDGIILSTPAEKWDIGVEVLIKAKDGSMKPAEDATYELEDGSKLVVEGGKVKEIVAVEDKKEDKKEEKPEDMKAEFAKLEEQFNKLVEATRILTESFSKLPVSDKINLSPDNGVSNEEFGRKPISKKEKNLKEIYSVLEEIKAEQKNKNNK